MSEGSLALEYQVMSLMLLHQLHYFTKNIMVKAHHYEPDSMHLVAAMTCSRVFSGGPVNFCRLYPAIYFRNCREITFWWELRLPRARWGSSRSMAG